MYSERYRDLIDAADSIVDMQKCSEQVCGVSFNISWYICHIPCLGKAFSGAHGKPVSEVAADSLPERGWRDERTTYEKVRIR